MLDSLGSTLSGSTIDNFFTRHGKKPKEDELTVNEAIQCLEEELCRPASEKKRLDQEDSAAPDTSTPATPNVFADEPAVHLELEKIDFSGPHVHPTSVQPSSLSNDQKRKESVPVHPTEPSQQPLTDLTQAVIDSASTRVPVGYQASSLTPTESLTPTAASAPGRAQRQNSSSSSTSEAEGDEFPGANGAEYNLERVINVKNCPLCHRPRLNSKAEVDIVTHLAVCASQDWARVDRIVVSNFVTANQAQRKWYTKLVAKVSAGDYKLGAVSASVLIYETDCLKELFRTRPISLYKTA